MDKEKQPAAAQAEQGSGKTRKAIEIEDYNEAARRAIKEESQRRAVRAAVKASSEVREAQKKATSRAEAPMFTPEEAEEDEGLDDYEKELLAFERRLEMARKQTSPSELEDADHVYESLKNSSELSRQESIELSEKEKTARDLMRKKMTENMIDAYIESSKDRERIAAAEFAYQYNLSELRKKDPSQIGPSNDAMRTAQTEIMDIKDKAAKRAEGNPEAVDTARMHEMGSYLSSRRRGESMIAPYVEEKLGRVVDVARSGKMVYIEGHTGAGKTELAKLASIRMNIEKRAVAETILHRVEDSAAIEARFAEYAKEEGLDKQLEEYVQSGEVEKRFDKEMVQTGELQRRYDEANAEHQRKNPGADDLDKKQFEEDQKKAYTEERKDVWMEQRKEPWKRQEEGRYYKARVEALQEEYNKGEGFARQMFGPIVLSASPNMEERDLFGRVELRASRNGGTESVFKMSELIRAAKEGRPVIIDEINLVPNGIRSSLNGLLALKPGQKFIIPSSNGQSIVVKEGFCVIATGNPNDEGFGYFDRNEEDAAGKDRYEKIDFSYLPMDLNHGYEGQQHPEKNQLFHVAIGSILEKDGSLRLPDMDRSLKDIFALAQFAYATQLIFSKTWEQVDPKLSEGFVSGGDDVELRLHSPMSMRGIMQVLDTWRHGESMDISKALFEYITGFRPEDQALLMKLGKKFDLFRDGEGWKVGDLNVASRTGVSFDEVYAGGEYKYKRGDMTILGPREVVHRVYGDPLEKRDPDDYPSDEDIVSAEKEAIDDQPLTAEEVDDGREKIVSIDKYIKAFEILFDKCGCKREDYQAQGA